MRYMLERLKNKYFLSVILGAIAVLGFAPFNWFLCPVIAICLFFVILDEKCHDKWQFFNAGFAFGFGYFLGGIYWIAISLLVDASSYAWLIPFALTLIPGALACYVAFAALCYGLLVKRLNIEKYWQKIILFSLIWVFFEVLRSVLFTGFPWNLFGYVWLFNIYFSQAANIFGTFGLSLFFVLFSLSLIVWFKKGRVKSDIIFAALMADLLILQFLYGFFYVKNNPVQVKDVNLRIVQGNIKQEVKWDEYRKYLNLQKHITLSKQAGFHDVDLIFWSESAIEYALHQANKELIEMVNRVVPKNGDLVSGILRFELSDEENFLISKAFNSVALFDGAKVSDIYDKHHLVPFGEYIPLQEYLPFIKKITHGSIGFSEGSGARTIKSKHLSFSPLICYEAIFLDKIIDKNNTPDLLAVLTNDAWFGNSLGPYQHFDIHKMRAIEYGISLVRAANTGISAYIDPFGRVVNKLSLNKSGILDVKLIAKNQDTLFLKFGHLIFAISFLALTTILLITLHSGSDPKCKVRLTKGV